MKRLKTFARMKLDTPSSSNGTPTSKADITTKSMDTPAENPFVARPKAHSEHKVPESEERKKKTRSGRLQNMYNWIASKGRSHDSKNDGDSRDRTSSEPDASRTLSVSVSEMSLGRARALTAVGEVEEAIAIAAKRYERMVTEYGKERQLSAISVEFSGLSVPLITLQAYMFRIAKYLSLAHEEELTIYSTGFRSVLTSTILVDRLLKMNPELRLTSRNVHRLFLVAAFLADKMLEDRVVHSTLMAKVGGIAAKELCVFERLFFKQCNFNVNVSADELRQAYQVLIPEFEMPEWAP